MLSFDVVCESCQESNDTTMCEMMMWDGRNRYEFKPENSFFFLDCRLKLDQDFKNNNCFNFYTDYFATDCTDWLMMIVTNFLN